MRPHAKFKGDRALPDDDYHAGAFERESTYTPSEQQWVDRRVETTKQASAQIDSAFPELAGLKWQERMEWS